MSSIIKENAWDDGKQEKVKKVQLTYDDKVIHSIEITYEGTKLKSQRRGSVELVGLKSDEFTLGSDEHITSISAYVKKLSSQDGIISLTFKTNKNTFGPYGGTEISSFLHSALEVPGKHIAGFFGSFQKVLNTIDVHYAYIGEQKLEAVGANLTWDDGSSDHEGVTNVYIRHHVDHGIISVQFDYVKGGEPKKGLVRGTGKGIEESGILPGEFVINHPEEYLVSVEGWHDSTAMRGIQFKTNQKTSTYFGKEVRDDDDGTKFTLQVEGKKIIGFHGSASNLLHTIGTYVVPLPKDHVITEEARGGKTGAVWDYRYKHDDHVKAVHVGQDVGGIKAIMFEYTKGFEVFPKQDGKRKAGFTKFDLKSDEYITHIDGTYEGTHATKGVVVITSLIFYTNKNKEGRRFGVNSGKLLEFKEVADYKITGFHGLAGEDLIHAIGFYRTPIRTIPVTGASGVDDDAVNKVLPITN